MTAATPLNKHLSGRDELLGKQSAVEQAGAACRLMAMITLAHRRNLSYQLHWHWTRLHLLFVVHGHAHKRFPARTCTRGAPFWEVMGASRGSPTTRALNGPQACCQTSPYLMCDSTTSHAGAAYLLA